MIVGKANLEKNQIAKPVYNFEVQDWEKKEKIITAWMQVWIRGFNYLPAISGFI